MQQDKTTYTVDFKNAHNYFEIHDALKSGLNFPEYYGANLDALWDCLRDMID
ncbi:MAG: barstar family protein, partial [Candidatus Avispirillum sp.]